MDDTPPPDGRPLPLPGHYSTYLTFYTSHFTLGVYAMLNGGGMERVGRVFTRLTVLEKVADRKYLCQCSCGNKTAVRWEALRKGKTKSCGCLRGEIKPPADRAHSEFGVHKHPLYHVWRGMLKRCYEPRHVRFRNYGARGISVCLEWQKDFFAFAGHVGTRPHGTTLDRIDNSGNYEPGNVRWATPKEQSLNSNAGKKVLVRNVLMSRADAEKVLGVGTAAVRKAAKDCASTEEALALAWLRKQAVALQRPGKQVNWDALKERIPAAIKHLKISRA